MKYEDLEHFLAMQLPLNRKEQFFTATVLPALLFHRGLDNLYAFLHLLDGFPCEVDATTSGDGFLFFTEYNLKQSGGEKSVGKQIEVKSNQTPDVVILIMRPRTLLIVIEGKMFQRVSQRELARQMKDQSDVVIEALTTQSPVPPEQVFHVALLPKPLGLSSTADYQVINWEVFLDNTRFDVADNYFYNFLKYALAHYGHLVAASSDKASTVERELSGRQILEEFQRFTSFWVGRQGGEGEIIEDIKENSWGRRKYSVNSEKPKKGQPGNWIPAARFAELVEQNRPVS